MHVLWGPSSVLITYIICPPRPSQLISSRRLLITHRSINSAFTGDLHFPEIHAFILIAHKAHSFSIPIPRRFASNFCAQSSSGRFQRHETKGTRGTTTYLFFCWLSNPPSIEPRPTHQQRLLFFKSSGGWVKIKLKAPTLPRIRYMSCFDLTRAPVATAARAAATGLVSMSRGDSFSTRSKLLATLVGTKA